MKKIYIIFVVATAALLSSCASTYQYCQIYETKPVKNDGSIKNEDGVLRYENEQCVIDYNFWSNGGSADFYFYNKTNEIIYIDLAKSFYVSNDIAYDLYGAREWNQSSSVGTASSLAYTYGESVAASLAVGVIIPGILPYGYIGAAGAKASKTASRMARATAKNTVTQVTSSSVTTKEKQIVAVPPHTKKYINTHNITLSPYLSCDLQRYPSTSARLNFSADNSPYRFSDVITYTVGENKQPITVNSNFYVSSITNYAEPEIVVMKERGEPCENMRDPDYIEPSQALFDKVVKDNICEINSSFYTTYDAKTTKTLYKDNLEEFKYDYEHNAYILSSSHSDVWVGVAFVGIFAALGAIAAIFGF